MPMRRIERYFQSKIIGSLLKNLSGFIRNSGGYPGWSILITKHSYFKPVVFNSAKNKWDLFSIFPLKWGMCRSDPFMPQISKDFKAVSIQK